jgi:hypothetical protein
VNRLAEIARAGRDATINHCSQKDVMMVRRNTPIAQHAPEEPCHGQFLHTIANAQEALLTRMVCDVEMSAAEEAQIMVDLGRLEYVAKCSRYLH